MVQSWIEAREIQSEKANLTVLFEKYVPVLLDVLRLRFKKVTPIVEISHVAVTMFSSSLHFVILWRGDRVWTSKRDHTALDAFNRSICYCFTP
jgi:hypothetical protein